MIDLRSDTVTRPTPAMREAIARAEVGDDQFGDDPTVRRLEERIATLLGKERALFFPSGIQANETALMTLCAPATEVVVEARCHLADWEDGAPAQLAQVLLRGVPTTDGVLTAEAVEGAIRAPSPVQPRTSAIAVENTHNAAGGRIVPLATMRAIRAVADRHALPIHLDGARLWNASAATGVPLADFAAQADTVMVSLSKGLGCPVGSLLAGPQAIMECAWRNRRRLGGAMRQSGILAAAGLYALDHHLERLPEDHARARRLGELLAQVSGLTVVPPDTNILMVDLAEDRMDAPTLVQALGRRGILVTAFSKRRVRFVTHLDVDDAGIEAAAAGVREILA
jgi:threonine aldolase